MAHRRELKEAKKEVELEHRIEAVEKFIAKIKPDTYNFLTGYISQIGKQLQQVNSIAMEMQDFIKERGLMTEYQQWLEAKYPKVDTPEGPKCPSCGGTGYVGDKEECPTCHPNKIQEPPESK